MTMKQVLFLGLIVVNVQKEEPDLRSFLRFYRSPWRNFKIYISDVRVEFMKLDRHLNSEDKIKYAKVTSNA